MTERLLFCWSHKAVAENPEYCWPHDIAAMPEPCDIHPAHIQKADPIFVFDPNHNATTPCAECGHAYDRHWDTWETPPTPIGCKYCACQTFTEPTP